MNIVRGKTITGSVGVVLLSVFYCLPSHPSAGAAPLDALAHSVLFAGLGLWFGWLAGGGAWVIAPLAALGALLEVVQWWVGGYARIEVADILANEAGVGLALVLLWLRSIRRLKQGGQC